MPSTRFTFAAVALGLTLLALALGRNSGPAETFSFDQWDHERKAKVPLIERAKVAEAPERRSSGAN